MKPVSLFLAGSLLANLALAGLYFMRDTPADTMPAVAAPDRATPARKAKDDALRAALASGNMAALQAAGVPADVARDLMVGRALTRAAERMRAAQSKATNDGRWWRNRSMSGSREQQLIARRELADALIAAVGDDFGLAGGDATQLAFLSPEKREALRRITQDYDEMMARFGAGGPQLASDKEKLRLLRAERDRDIAALLTPGERLAYEMRTTPSAATVRSRYGDAIETEAEFAKIYALQKAFDEKHPREALSGRISPEALRARSDAERQLENDLRAAVGGDRYAELRRAADPDLRTVDSLVNRLNLPPATTNQVAATRETFSAESQRINNDATIPFPQRRAQIQELATRAKAEVTRALGGEAGEAYAQSSPWIAMLQGGTAYATTPQSGSPPLIGGSQSVYPVLPAGAGGPGARQVFLSGTAAVDGASPDRANPNSNVHVMTFSTTAPDGGTVNPTSGPSGAPQTRIVPGTPPPAP